jgi:hypothetical protein
MTNFLNENVFGLGTTQNAWYSGAQWTAQATVASADLWSTVVKRYCRFISSQNGSRSLWYRHFIEPKGFLDNTYGAAQATLRVSECLACYPNSFTPTANHWGLVQWGFAGSTTTAPVTGRTQDGVPWCPFVGFLAHLVHVTPIFDTTFNWRCVVHDASGIILHDEDTGIDAYNTPREMIIELVAETSTINWYIDDTLVSTYTIADGDTPGQDSTFTDGEWKLMYHCSAVSGVAATTLAMTFLFHMGPCTPRVSIQQVDGSAV